MQINTRFAKIDAIHNSENISMDNQVRRIIDLSAYGDLGIILKLQSGVFYTNQSAGLACKHPQIEGVFFPLPVKPGKKELFSLLQHFGGTQHLEPADADFVDKILHRNEHMFCL